LGAFFVVNLFLIIKNKLTSKVIYHLCLQCFDTVGWASGRASGP